MSNGGSVDLDAAPVSMSSVPAGISGASAPATRAPRCARDQLGRRIQPLVTRAGGCTARCDTLRELRHRTTSAEHTPVPLGRAPATGHRTPNPVSGALSPLSTAPAVESSATGLSSRAFISRTPAHPSPSDLRSYRDRARRLRTRALKRWTRALKPRCRIRKSSPLASVSTRHRALRPPSHVPI